MNEVRKQSPERTCSWTPADCRSDIWETSCGKDVALDDTPQEYGMCYCCYCGGRLNGIAYQGNEKCEARRTTPDREAITKLAEINGQLREQIERYQAVCAAAYQLVGVVDGPLRFLDALSNAANGEPMSTEDALNLLPVTLDECDSFRTVLTSDKGGA
ncbi:hypothetical protein [Burkholderia pseudomallei]|uniref:hypothetical protein n=1 Tax=Burkholderia pseudomallei TaxID=28450 RepID=UPI0019DA06D6|nr:hypothetical protein [Burkholderia pseudomallei]MBF3874257.1 hypothetical protein [Burkholderia pseudomallei]MBF3906427.1 hypothetical protein [Burkholderia pseudomallei]MCV9985206.1 hypothetical protein [Burkholderia pseudomallei]MCV9991512.1 hypothetical protein [Burkholderia pseudomallei]MCW0132759.1 hypothetical protein [Burkholderia pseudomallei]